MSASAIASFDTTVQTTNGRLKELSQKLEWHDGRQRAYLALRAVLHALRDRLTPEESADLAAQLPMLVRGFYYEGWRPGGKPVKVHTKAQFFAHVERIFPELLPGDVELVVRAVFKVRSRRVAGGEIDDIRNSLSAQLRELWD